MALQHAALTFQHISLHESSLHFSAHRLQSLQHSLAVFISSTAAGCTSARAVLGAPSVSGAAQAPTITSAETNRSTFRMVSLCSFSLSWIRLLFEPAGAAPGLAGALLDLAVRRSALIADSVGVAGGDVLLLLAPRAPDLQPVAHLVSLPSLRKRTAVLVRVHRKRYFEVTLIGVPHGPTLPACGTRPPRSFEP